MTNVNARRWRTPLLTVHIVASVGAIGAAGVLLALGIAGLRGADPRTVYPAAHLVEAWVIAPLALAALVTGVTQAVVSGFSPLRHGWVRTKAVITLLLTVAVFVVLEPGLARLATADSVTGAQRLPVVLAPAAACVLLIVNATLGLVKPGRRKQRTPVNRDA